MSEENFEIVSPSDVREERLLQLLAVFVRRFGGEVVITQREFDMVEGLPVLASQTTPEHLKIRLVEEYELCDCGLCGDDLDD